MCEAICLVKSYVIVKRYVKRNIISDAISNIYVKRNKYCKRGKDGIYMLAEQNSFKKRSYHEVGRDINFWLYTSAHLTIECVVFSQSLPWCLSLI